MPPAQKVTSKDYTDEKDNKNTVAENTSIIRKIEKIIKKDRNKTED